MITPDEIQDKARRIYPKFVAAWIEGVADFFPCSLAANKQLSEDYSSASQEIQRLRSSAKESVGYGYSVRWEMRRSRRFGEQQFPAEIFFENAEDLLRHIGKFTEFRLLVQRVELIRRQQPLLESWIRDHWKQVLLVEKVVPDLLLVVSYLCEHPRPNCFPRELPLPISTKLIEQHEKILGEWLDRLLAPEYISSEFTHRQFSRRYGFRESEPHYVMRLLDDSLMEELRFPSREISLPLAAMCGLEIRNVEVVIVENKVNLLTYPATKRALAIGGLGHGVEVLMKLPWLSTSRVLYWGDIDVEGFAILSRLRDRCPQAESLFMDDVCLNRWADLVISGNGQDVLLPNHLTAGERGAWELCRANNWRLEQERIPQSYVVEQLAAVGAAAG